jgi:multiple sugar transport system ATP-binding protein
MASVDLEHVEKRYPDGTRAVADCTLHIDDGELLALVGPSGCGKSTLLRLVAGLETLTAGTLRIGDVAVGALSPQARNVAMVFQDYALYPHMSVRRNLEFPLRMRKLPPSEIARRVEWITSLLDLGRLLDRLPKQLSGGERQRVAMGRALVREPAVSLLDEPLSNLDAKLRVQVRAEIGELQHRIRTTMIYVTHDQVEAMTLGDRVAVMYHGRLQQVTAPRMLYDQPANAFVAGFIGNPPMNLFPTRLRLGDHGGPEITLAERIVPIAAGRVPAESLRSRREQPLTAGIRPEALRLAASEGAEGIIDVVVEHVEWLGHETLAYVRAGAPAPPGGVPLSADGIRLVARLHGMHPLAKGDAVRLQLDPESVYLFDADGQALSAPARSRPAPSPG